MADKDWDPMEEDIEEQGPVEDEDDSDEMINAQADEEEEEEPEDSKESEDEPEPEVRGGSPCILAAKRTALAELSMCPQAEPTVAEVAKAEKDRLKAQQQHKKQLIEKMREEQNVMAEQGEVGVCTQNTALCWWYTHDTSLYSVLSELQATRTQNRLQFLLRQAEIFQHFAPQAAVESKTKK